MRPKPAMQEKWVSSDLFQEAKSFYETGSYDKASARLQMLTLFYPLETKYWLALGHAEKMAGRHIGALAAYEVAQNIEPSLKKEGDLLCQMADCHFHLGDKKKAIAHLIEAKKWVIASRKESLQFLIEQWRKTHGPPR